MFALRYSGWLSDLVNTPPSDPYKQLKYWADRIEEALKRGNFEKAAEYQQKLDELKRLLGIETSPAGRPPAYQSPSERGNTPGVGQQQRSQPPAPVDTFVPSTPGTLPISGPAVAVGAAGLLLAIGAAVMLRRRKR